MPGFMVTECQTHGEVANQRAGGKCHCNYLCEMSKCLSFLGTSVAASGEKLMPTAFSVTTKGKGMC